MTAAAHAFPATEATRARPRTIAAWLFAVAGLVFTMVVVGGITRLTESGLSIVKWAPVSGTLPPLSAADWGAEFAAYRSSPQYTQVNAGMTLAAFKGIFWWEYFHRLLARFIGVAFALPLAWFALRRAIPSGYGWRLTAILALGGLQGVVGWWMVASGLVGQPAVAHERLAVHLVMALTIMSLCLWTALDLLLFPSAPLPLLGGAGGGGDRQRTFVVAPPPPGPLPEAGGGAEDRPARWIVPFFAVLSVQIVWGAFVAGLRAGHASDTWPLMFGQIVPPGLASIVDDPVSVQFVHRSLGWAVAAAALVVAWTTARAGAGWRAVALAGLVVLQFVLGVLTVVHGVPLALAAAHQAVAALLLAATVVTAHWSWQGERA